MLVIDCADMDKAAAIGKHDWPGPSCGQGTQEELEGDGLRSRSS